jgi:excinuclease UvrABC ATPase subunit
MQPQSDHEMGTDLPAPGIAEPETRLCRGVWNALCQMVSTRKKRLKHLVELHARYRRVQRKANTASGGKSPVR